MVVKVIDKKRKIELFLAILLSRSYKMSGMVKVSKLNESIKLKSVKNNNSFVVSINSDYIRTQIADHNFRSLLVTCLQAKYFFFLFSYITKNIVISFEEKTWKLIQIPWKILGEKKFLTLILTCLKLNANIKNNIFSELNCLKFFCLAFLHNSHNIAPFDP